MSHDAYHSYFTLFQLPQHLNLDAAALEKQFYALSRRLHPDRFAAKSAFEQETTLAASSHLNDAYRTLKDPILRTQYLLKLKGGDGGGTGHRRAKEADCSSKVAKRGL